jgi:hypothetical protein
MRNVWQNLLDKSYNDLEKKLCVSCLAMEIVGKLGIYTTALRQANNCPSSSLDALFSRNAPP